MSDIWSLFLSIHVDLYITFWNIRGTFMKLKWLLFSQVTLLSTFVGNT